MHPAGGRRQEGRVAQAHPCQRALHLEIGAGLHVVAEVIEAEFVVRAVGDVGVVGCLLGPDSCVVLEVSDGEAEEVSALVRAVQCLYDNMDPSLRLRPVRQVGTPGQGTDPARAEADRQADFRGVACPLNYVKTKLLLNQMTSGQVLSILLDQLRVWIGSDGAEIVSDITLPPTLPARLRQP